MKFIKLFEEFNIKGYRFGSDKGQIDAGTFYNTKPGQDKVPDGEIWKYDTEIEKDLEFENPLVLTDPRLEIDGDFGYDVTGFLAIEWGIDRTDPIQMERDVAREAVKRGYDGIIYADNEIQDLRNL